jgi:hypothetical protein
LHAANESPRGRVVQAASLKRLTASTSLSACWRRLRCRSGAFLQQSGVLLGHRVEIGDGIADLGDAGGLLDGGRVDLAPPRPVDCPRRLTRTGFGLG